MKMKNFYFIKMAWKTILFLLFWLQVTAVSLYAAPQIVKVNPSSAGQGVSGKLIAVYGTGFQCGMTVSFSSSTPAVTTANEPPSNQFVDQCPDFSTTPAGYATVKSNVKFFSDSNVFIYVKVPASPLITAQVTATMTFTNPDGSSGTSDLKINPAPQIYPPSNPATPAAGTSFDLTLNGKNFQNGATLTFSQAGISGSALSVDPNGSLAAARITISETAVAEMAAVTLTNPDGGSATQNSLFSILPLIGEKTPLLALYEDPRLINGRYITFQRFWNGEWSDEGDLTTTLTGIDRVELVMKSHPRLFQQMMGHMVYPNTEFQVWDGGGWGHLLAVSKRASNLGRGTFDLAYESLSGNGLVVYGTATSNGGIYYRRFFQAASATLSNNNSPSNCDKTLSGNSTLPCWGPETLMLNAGFTNKYLARVKLISNPDKTKNEILAVYQDDNPCNLTNPPCSTLFVRQWDGSMGTFSPPVALSSLLGTGSWVFDAIYSGTHYIPIVSWLEVLGVNDGTPKSYICSGNGTNFTCSQTGTSPAQAGTTSATNLYQVQLSADPFSDQVALGTREGSGSPGILKVQIGGWDGSNFIWPYPSDYGAINTLSSTLAGVTSQSDASFNLIWKKGSLGSSLFGIYTDAAGGLNYQVWGADSGWSGEIAISGLPTQNPLVSTASPYIFESIRFDSDPRSGDIFGGMKTSDALFSTIRWDGASWVDYQQLNPGDYLSTFKDPFGVAYFKNFPTLSEISFPFLFTQGDPSVTVSISGTMIQDGAVLSFPGFVQASTDTTTVSHDVTSGIDTITATGSISPSILPEAYDLTIVNPDRSQVVGKDLINIVPSSGDPVIYLVDPSSRGQGAVNQTVTLTGYNLPATGYSISFSGNISVTHQQILNSNKISIQLNVDSNAPVGARDVILTDTSTNLSYPFSGFFMVNYRPTITGVKPGSVLQGTTGSGILVSGSDFQAGADITLSDGAFSLGWSQPGNIPSTLNHNKMIGNRFYLSSGTSTSVVLNSIQVRAALVGPAGKLNGQVAIYDDLTPGGSPGNGAPGNLIVTSGIQVLTAGGANNSNTFRFSLNSPVPLPVPASYWVLVNVNGDQTIIPYTDNISSACNGEPNSAMICTAVSKDSLFGSWPKTGEDSSTWRQIRGRKMAISLSYYPVIGSSKIGLSTLGTGSYKDQMTGSQLTLDVNSKVPFLYSYIGLVDPGSPSAQMMIYDNTSSGTPGNLKTGLRNIANNHLTPNSLNLFPIPRYLGSDFSLLAGTYWAVTNVSGVSTTLTYEDPISGVSSVQSPQTYGNWLNPFPASPSVTLSRRYSLFGVKTLSTTGDTTATVTNGPDSNQITGTQFMVTADTNLVGISLHVEWVDSNNPYGSVAIYDDNGGVPGSLKITTVPQILKAHTFNTFTVPITTLPKGNGSYWIMANVAGSGTTLSYDEGTSNQSVKVPYLFNNGWPDAASITWTPLISGRRYAIRVLPDVIVSASVGASGNLITGTVTVDPNATPTTGTNPPRKICVINPDGGKTCEGFDPASLPLFQVLQGSQSTPAMVSYGTTAFSYPVSRKWNGYAPWSVETPSPILPGGSAQWSVLRSFPSIQPRPQEMIQGSLNASVLALEVWDGTTWGNPFNLIPSAVGSRSFDLAYESLSGNGMVVYGVPGNPVPSYRIWTGSVWTSPGGVGATNTTGSTVLWVRLEPNPKTNEMILAYLSGDVDVSTKKVTKATLHTLVWNGTSLLQGTAFGNENTFSAYINSTDNINLCQNCSPPLVGQSFDVAYEHVSGRAVLAWGKFGNETPLYAVWDGTLRTWSSSPLSANPAAPSAGTPLIYFKLAGDPNSNQIAMGTATIDGSSYDIQIWDGNTDTWGAAQNMLYDAANNLSFSLLYNVTPAVSTSTAPSDFNFNPGRNFDLAWEKDSGKLVTVFGSSHSVNSCMYRGSSLFPYSTRYKIWDSSSGLWTEDVLLPNIGEDLVPRWIQLVPDTSSNDLFLMVTGHPVTTYSTNQNLPGTVFCIAAENSSTQSDLKIITQLHYWRHQEAWVYKEAVSRASSSAIRAVLSGQNYTAYGESLMTAFSPDTTPPSPITDLNFTGDTNNGVTLQWSAAGDDGSLGRAASYTVGYSLSSIYDDTDFANIPSGQKVPVSATPFPVNTALTYTEMYTVTGLNPSTTYCFAVVAKDRGGNSSSVSTVNPCVKTASAGTSGAGIIAPGSIKDLTIVPGTLFNNSVQLTWTAPGSTGYLLRTAAAAYDLRYSSAPIVDESAFDAATPVIATDGSGRNGLSAPHSAPTKEFFTFNILPSAGTTYFAIKACGSLALNSRNLRCDGILSPLNVSFVDNNNVRNINLSSCPDNLNHSNNSPVCVINSVSSGAIAPSAIADLMVSSVSSNSMTLRWTSPLYTTQGSWYDLRLSTGPITPSTNFDTLNQIKGVPSPFVGGSAVQSFTVTNLPSNATTGIRYYFVMKTLNRNPLDSTKPFFSLSNAAQGTTITVFDNVPPTPIKDLTVIQKGINQNSILLSWTATGDDGTVGAATEYDIRYSTSPVTDDTAFQNSDRAVNTPYPLPSGNTEFFTVTGLNSNTVYYFAVKAIDKGSNDSGLPSSCFTLLPDDTKIPSDCSGHTALHSGYNLVSIPYRLSGKNDPDTVFGNDVTKPVTVYRWENGAYSVPSMIAEVAGYFLYAPANNSVLTATDPSGKLVKNPETAGTVTLPLQSGWNMIGNPYLHSIYLKDTCIRSGSGPSLPFASAVASMIIGNSIYSYDGTKYNAEPYHDAAPPPYNNPDAQINPWNGYWLQLLAGGSNYSFIYPNPPGACP